MPACASPIHYLARIRHGNKVRRNAHLVVTTVHHPGERELDPWPAVDIRGVIQGRSRILTATDVCKHLIEPACWHKPISQNHAEHCCRPWMR
jgi:hypothetical protein